MIPTEDAITRLSAAEQAATVRALLVKYNLDVSVATLDALVARCEQAERVIAGVRSKTALDVVAEKMKAEDRAEAAERRVQQLEEELRRLRDSR